MKAIIVYESFFGNTEKIAIAISEAISQATDVQIIRVSEVTPAHLQGMDVFIAGSPTRAFKPTDGMTTFLGNIPGGSLKDIKVAAFDTRMPAEDVKNGVYSLFSGMFGFAAKKIADKLQKKGGVLIVPPEGFSVLGSEGPLKEGELERAAEWGKAILEKINL